MALTASWAAIVGAADAASTRPLRIRWAGRPSPGEPPKPGTLVIACATSAAALRIQHSADVIVDRVNATFGYDAIGRIRVERGSAASLEGTGRPGAANRRPPLRAPTADERARTAELVRPIEHDRLREALSRLGECVLVTGAASTSPSNLHDQIIAPEGNDTGPVAANEPRKPADELTEHDE